MDILKSYNLFRYHYLCTVLRLARKMIAREDTEKMIQRLRNRKRYAGRRVLNGTETNDYIKARLHENKPFMLARLGGAELFLMRAFYFETKSKYQKSLKQAKDCSGIFPSEHNTGLIFTDTMLKAMGNADLIGFSEQSPDVYFYRKYAKKAELSYLLAFEPWNYPDDPWTEALKGKKVLIVHPFEATIRQQYQIREKLFPPYNILPDFELLTLKAVQTVADASDERFASWSEALHFMTEEIKKIDFDVAILGCGAYGFPLAAAIKEMGKTAIHLGGATQILFGIKGKRWEGNYFSYVNRYFNSNWVYPSINETPPGKHKVEDGPYWQ